VAESVTRLAGTTFTIRETPGWAEGSPPQERLDQALTRLLAGQPAVADSVLTVSNLCKEAGVGRDFYYRTPQAVARFTAARTTAGTPGTELARLRDRAAALARESRDSRRDHASQISELEDQVKAYAGQRVRVHFVGD
jgi:hypothetical protein